MSGVQPSQRGVDIRDFGGGRGQGGARDHDDGNAAFASGDQFRAGRIAAGILGDQDVDAMLGEERPFAVEGEGASFRHDQAVQRPQLLRWRLYATQDVAMLRRGQKGREIVLADGEKDAATFGANGVGRRLHDRYVDPTIAVVGGPGRPSEGEHRDAGFGRRLDRVGGHLRGEWMGCVDDEVDLSAFEVKLKAVDATEPAGPCLGRWQYGGSRTAGDGIGDFEPRVIGQGAAEREPLAGTTEYEDATARRCHL